MAACAAARTVKAAAGTVVVVVGLPLVSVIRALAPAAVTDETTIAKVRRGTRIRTNSGY